jgi:hypothetical protein
MIVSKIMQALYLKIYINIVASKTKTEIYACSIKGGKIKDEKSRSFEGEELSKDMLNFIQSFISDSPYYYISLLDRSKTQGAVPTCKLENFLGSVNKEDYKTFCNNDWTGYSSKVDLIYLEKHYAKIGLDFIFSPFSIIENFFQDKIIGERALYVLVQEESIAISIFEGSQLKFAQFVELSTKKVEHAISIEEPKEELFTLDDEPTLVNLEDIDIDEEFGDLDDLTNIQDLDSMDEFDDFTEVKVKSGTGLFEEPFKKQEENAYSFDEDYKRFTAIKDALKLYYTDEKYDNNFIESVYVGAACELNHTLKNYLEEELFLKVYIRQVEICAEVFELARREKV